MVVCSLDYCLLNMPAKDLYHQIVREALEQEGWVVTHDTYFMYMGKRRGFIDLGAEMIGAEKDKDVIAVEVKTFAGLSEIEDFRDALGQYLLYKLALQKKEPERVLYLAIPEDFYVDFFDDAFFVEITNLYEVKIIVFNPETKQIVQWKM